MQRERKAGDLLGNRSQLHRHPLRIHREHLRRDEYLRWRREMPDLDGDVRDRELQRVHLHAGGELLGDEVHMPDRPDGLLPLRVHDERLQSELHERQRLRERLRVLGRQVRERRGARQGLHERRAMRLWPLRRRSLLQQRELQSLLRLQRRRNLRTAGRRLDRQQLPGDQPLRRDERLRRRRELPDLDGDVRGRELHRRDPFRGVLLLGHELDMPGTGEVVLRAVRLWRKHLQDTVLDRRRLLSRGLLLRFERPVRGEGPFWGRLLVDRPVRDRRVRRRRRLLRQRLRGELRELQAARIQRNLQPGHGRDHV